MKDKFYVTTPIYYVNGAPHLGHAYTSILADVFARYGRLTKEEVFFLTGTDEHGAKIVRAAEDQKTDVKKFVDDNAGKFKDLLLFLNISNDFFIRTSDNENHFKGAEKLWQAIDKQGDIYKSKYRGLYCVGCEAFITEKELKDGKCVYHDLKPEVVEEENYFFRLSKYGEQIKSVIDSGEMKIFPEARKNETLAFIESGLNDISFSRPSKDIKWGIPVPGDSSQTMYVWCDALANYLSALGYCCGEELFKKFWPADLHILAKDILRFHTIIWPAMLMSAGLPLPKSFLIHGFINVDGRKMSKTIGNVIDPFLVIDKKEYGGPDPLRYYLCRYMTPFEDGDFTWEKFKKVYNADLARGLGNFTSRVFKMVFSYFDGRIERPDDTLLSSVPLIEDGEETFSVPYIFEHFVRKNYIDNMKEMKFNLALDAVWEALSKLDCYIQKYQPFKLIETDREKTAAILWSLLYGLVEISEMIYPFMPQTAEKIIGALSVKFVSEDRERFFLKDFSGNLFPRKD